MRTSSRATYAFAGNRLGLLVTKGGVLIKDFPVRGLSSFQPDAQQPPSESSNLDHHDSTRRQRLTVMLPQIRLRLDNTHQGSILNTMISCRSAYRLGQEISSRFSARNVTSLPRTPIVLRQNAAGSRRFASTNGGTSSHSNSTSWTSLNIGLAGVLGLTSLATALTLIRPPAAVVLDSVKTPSLSKNGSAAVGTENPATASPEDIRKAIAELQSALSGKVVTDHDSLVTYGSSPNSYHPASPHAVAVRVHSTEDVVKVVNVARKYQIPIVPYSGATSLEGHYSGVSAA